MCFSAEASFVAGAALVGCSALTLRMAATTDRRYLALAALPLFFGFQQISEGALWVSLGADIEAPAVLPMTVFLFFAYWFWPVWVPMSAALVEPERRRRLLFWGASGVGFCLGLALFLPVVLSPEVLQVTLVKHSIRYANPEMFPREGAKIVARSIYAVIICVPLLASSLRPLRVFGWLILGSVIFGFLFLSYAFTSVWCFIAAVISSYIYVVLRMVQGQSSDGSIA